MNYIEKKTMFITLFIRYIFACYLYYKLHKDFLAIDASTKKPNSLLLSFLPFLWVENLFVKIKTWLFPKTFVNNLKSNK